MTLIVNLSAIHTLNNILLNVLPKFASIYDKYANKCCGKYCSFFGFSPSGYLWVLRHYKQFQTAIDNYKLGKISTDEFLNQLLQKFNFLKNAKFSEETRQALFDRKAEFFCLKGVTAFNQLTKELIAKALLEEAWNSLILFTESDALKFAALVARNEPVYFISNTNPLNIHKIVFELRQKFPDLLQKEVDISTSPDNHPLSMGSNIFFCLSYRYQAYKTEQQNQAHNFLGTAAMLKMLLDDIYITDKSTITFVSNYEPDIQQAKKLLPEQNVCKATTYFINSNTPSDVKKGFVV